MIIGAKKNKILFEYAGIILYLISNLIPSNNGCAIPVYPVLLGPNRFCLNPKIFRSNNVINITLINTKITKIK